MIRKELDPFAGGDERAVAGRRAEEQLAFYLKRAFERDKNVHVFNSLRFESEGDAAQIDHLVMHKYGLILVESKSITGHVTINEHGEWERRGGGRSVGIPSPILQAQRQTAFLRHLLRENVERLLSKLLGFRKQFGALRCDVLVAISDSGIIHRPDNLDLSEVCKADQVPERVQAIMKHLRGANSLLSLNLKDVVLDLRPEEQERIALFFVEKHRPLNVPAIKPTPQRSMAPPPVPASPGFHCRACGGKRLAVQYAHSYYFKCLECGGNTPARALCPHCQSQAKIRKSGLQFHSDCAACGKSAPFFTNPSGS